MTAIARLSEFIVKTTLDDCPREALVHIRRAALDTVGVILAGTAEPAARIVRQVARTEGGLPLCTVLGTALRTSPTWAALANGVAGHAHDFDDTSFALVGHPSVPLLAAALACAEAEPTDGRALALAYAVGFEISTALGAALNPGHYARGWHATVSLGSFGCTGAAARILGLDIIQTGHALGLAASMASGVKENFGSMTKPFHAGHAARNGVLAALLAREGFTAAPSALDGSQGWLAVAGDGAGGVEALRRVLDGLGQSWNLVATGVAVKPYPSCALTHAAIDALIELKERHRIAVDQVTEVEVGVSRMAPGVLIHRQPTTALQRKFSMPFCAAAALADGRVDFASFEDGEVRDGKVRALMDRVRMVVDPALPERLEDQGWSRVAVRLRDGRVLDSPPRGATGDPSRPLSLEALRAKFLGCAAGVLTPEEAEGVAAQLERLDELPDVRALTGRLVSPLD